MRNTKVDWVDSTWNPVTGCYHNCPYCYARRIATRFDGKADKRPYIQLKDKPDIFDIHEPLRDQDGRAMPYPFGFAPTFHRYRLDEPGRWTRPSTIFVCSMADLFGEWVPDEWISEVLSACRRASQHIYLFLTKNPKRYIDLAKQKRLPAGEGFWYGTTITTPDELYYYAAPEFNINTFLSIEPILAPFDRSRVSPEHFQKWVIVGAETGNRKGKVVPEKAWVDEIVAACRKLGSPVFMKESLRTIMGDDFIQEYPWQEKGAGQ